MQFLMHKSKAGGCHEVQQVHSKGKDSTYRSGDNFKNKQMQWDGKHVPPPQSKI